MPPRILIALTVFFFPAPPSAESIFPGYEWRELVNGVYVHMREDPFAGPVDGNSTVIINDEDVFVIDTHINSAAARAVRFKTPIRTSKFLRIQRRWKNCGKNGRRLSKAEGALSRKRTRSAFFPLPTPSKRKTQTAPSPIASMPAMWTR